MMHSKQEAASARSNAMPSTAFEAELRLALSHYHEPQWLAEHSPLAAPYFLGETLQSDPATGRLRAPGEQLQAVLYDSALLLW
ncbi:MAG: hypothetical protein ACRDIB_09985, partial [Ardenticatenaceae bacterium]